MQRLAYCCHIVALGAGVVLLIGAWAGAHNNAWPAGWFTAIAQWPGERAWIIGVFLATMPLAVLFGGRGEARRAERRWRRHYGTAPPRCYVQAYTNCVLFFMLVFYIIPVSLVLRLPRMIMNNLFFLALAVSAVLGALAFYLPYRRVRTIRRWLDQGVPVCLECGYALQGVSSGVCPECGSSYDYPLRDGQPVLPGTLFL